MIALIIISLMLIINVCAIRNAADKAYHKGYEDAQKDFERGYAQGYLDCIEQNQE